MTKGSVDMICTLVRSDYKKAKVLWKYTEKLAIILLGKTEKMFLSRLWEKYWSLKDALRVLARKWPQDIQTTKWVKAELPHVHLEGCNKLNWISQETDPRYVLSEGI